MKKLVLSLSLLLLVTAATLTFGQEQTPATDTAKPAETGSTFKAPELAHNLENLPQHYPLVSLFAGVKSAGVFLRNDTKLKESLYQGYSLGLGSALNLAWPRFTLSLALGWQANNIDVVRADPNTGPVFGDPQETISTSFGDLSLATRIHLPAGIQIGPVFQVLFGSDTSFSVASADEVAYTLMAGGEILMHISQDNDSIWQGGLQVVQDISLLDRTVIVTQGFLNLGIPLNKAHHREIHTTTHYLEKVKQVTKYRDHYFVSLGVIYFPTASFKLPNYTRDYLTELSKYLTENKKNWEKLQITSHTDVRGSVEENTKLSKSRAATILEVLLQAGLAANMVDIHSLSATDPIEASLAEVSLARNRRVELSLSGGEGVRLLEEQLGFLQRRFRRIQAKCRIGECRQEEN